MRATDGLQAVSLSGGGAYAAYEVGVMKALFGGDSVATGYAPLEAEIFTGTSAGAVNATMIVSHPEDLISAIRAVERVWVDVISDRQRNCGNGVFRFRGNPLRYLDLRCLMTDPARPFVELAEDSAFFARDWFERGVDFLLSSESIENRTLELFNLSSFISPEPFKQLIREVVSLENVRRSERALRIVATNWETGEAMTFTNADLSDEFGYQIIMGSTAIPGVFPPHYIAGQPYVDGQLVMSTPLKCAIEAGATTLHVIYLDPDIERIPLRRLQNTLDTMDRALTINFAIKTNEDIDTAAWINEGLEAIERIGKSKAPSDADMRAFIRVASKVEERLREGMPYKKLTIHRYHPHDDLGGGPLGLLNFERDRMRALVERGFDDAVRHDCARSHCILP
jgi:predicted acylesterase/phospholipase RssA